MNERLLESVAGHWSRIAGNGHSVLVAGERYVQPYVYLVAHVIEMWAAGWDDADFDSVAALSGASALFAYEPNEWMPKYAHLYVDPANRIAEATGFGYEWIRWSDAQDAFRCIRESVDSGVPLKGWDWENCVFAGYRDATCDEERQVFVMAAGPEDYAEWRSWEQFEEWVKRVLSWNQQRLGRYKGPTPAASPDRTAIRVIRDLAAWASEPPEDVAKAFPKAQFGLRGIAAYGQDCADTRTYKEWIACHPINPQWTVRNSSAVYLESVADFFAPAVNSSIMAASEAYRECYRSWQRFYELLGHCAPEGAGRDPGRRAEAASLIEHWHSQESRAIANLTTALAQLEQ